MPSYNTGHFGGHIGSVQRSSRGLEAQTEEAVRVLHGLDGRLDGIEGELREEKRLRGIQDDRITKLAGIRPGPVYSEPVGVSGVGEVPRRVFRDEGAADGFGRLVRNLYKGEERAVHFNTSALTALTDTGGGFTANEIISEQILARLEQAGSLYPICGRIPMGARSLEIPRATTQPTAGFLVEAVEPSEASMAFGGLRFEAKELGVYLTVPNTLIEDAAVVDLGNYVGNLLIRSVAKHRDQMIAKGTGAPADGGMVGILNSPDVSVETMASGEVAFSNLAFKHLTQLEAAVLDDGSDNLQYVMSRSLLKIVKDLSGTAAGPIWHPPMLSQPSTLNGYPFTLSPHFPASGDSGVSKKFVAFGNFETGVLIGERQQVTLATSRDFKFSQRLTAFLVLYRFDMHVIPGSETGKNPIVVLKTAAE